MMEPKLSQSQIQENYQSVLDQISSAAKTVGRDSGDVRLVVVTKGHPVETVEAVIEAGGRYIGENYVEDALPKIDALQDCDVQWHMIGHIQSRKAQSVCAHFSWVHSVDRMKIARRLDRFSGELNNKLPVLLECNVSGEESKFGYPVWNESLKQKFMEQVISLLALPNLEIRGLMTMPPFGRDPEESRPYFQKLRRLQADLKDRFPQTDWHELSMGMSNDFEIAVQEGATFVRVGTAIVGPRP